MNVKIFPRNIRLAEEKISEGHVVTVGRDGNRIFIEYRPSSSTGTEIIIFQHDADQTFVWHRCQAERNGYSKGCWHLAIAYALKISSEVDLEFVSAPDQKWVSEDLTEAFFGRPGEFRNLEFKPEGGPPPIKTIPQSLYPEDAKNIFRFSLPEALLNKVFAFRERQKARLTPEQLARVPQNVNYIPQGNEVTFAVAALLYDIWAPPLLMGPKGSGKSTLVEALAEIMCLPLCRLSGGIDVNADYLLGTKTLEPVDTAPKQLVAKIAVSCAKNGTPLTEEEFSQISAGQGAMRVVHEPGILLQAVTGGEMILVDEINVLIPEVTSILHTLLDWQRTITVPGLGEVKAHPDFRLIACMNVGYMGTRPLNNAFRDRFRGIQVQGISHETLLDLLETKVQKDIAKTLAAIYEDLYSSVYSPTGATLTENCISLRSLLRAAEEVNMGVAPVKEIIVSCLTESIESEAERTQVKDLVEMRL